MAETTTQYVQRSGVTPLDDSAYQPIQYLVPEKGIAPDLAPAQCGEEFLQGSLNVVWRDGRVRTRPGFQQHFGSGQLGATVVGGTIWHRWFLGLGYTDYLIAGVAVAGSATGGGDIVLYAGSTNTFTSIIASAYTFMNSSATMEFHEMRTSSSGIKLIAVAEAFPHVVGTNFCKWWSGDTASTFVNLSTSTMGCHGAVWKSHFLLGDTVDTADSRVPFRVHWSALGDPTVWAGTASAGSLDLVDLNTQPIYRFLPLRRTLMVYKARGVHSLTYKGSPLYFSQSLENETIDPYGPRSICPVLGGDAHFVATHSGVIMWDGQTISRIGYGRLDRTIAEVIDLTKSRYVTAYFWQATQEVFLTIPTTSGTYRTYVYNMNADGWWQIDHYDFIATMMGDAIANVADAGPFLIGTTQNSPRAVIRYLDTRYFEEIPLQSAGTQFDPTTPKIDSGALLFDYDAHKDFISIDPYAQCLRDADALKLTISVQAAENPLVGAQQFNWIATGSFPYDPLQDITSHKMDFTHGGRWLTYRMEMQDNLGEFWGMTLQPSPRSRFQRNR